MTTYPCLARLRDHLAKNGGAMGAEQATLGIDVLREYLQDGAKLGRGLREEMAQFRPSDPLGATLAYLFVITIDGATHEGRESALAAYAAADQPLAAEAGELHAIMVSDAFRLAVGRRPIQGSNKGCSPK